MNIPDTSTSLVRFDKAAYVATLETLPADHRAAFAATSAQRLLTGVSPLLARTRPRALEVLSDALETVWQVLAGDALDRDSLERYLPRCAELVPDLDRDPSLPDLVEIDFAARVTCFAVRTLLTGDSRDAARAAEKPYSMLDIYVTNDLGVDWEGPEGEEKVLAHPLIQAELRRQRRDLDELLVLSSRGQDVRLAVIRLRDRARDEGRDLYGPSSSRSC